MENEMFDTGKGPGGCGAGEKVVSYLYGELYGAEKTRFEDHLGECANCAEELAAFSSIRMSVADWKESEVPAAPAGILERDEPRTGLFERLTGLFSSSFGLKALVGAAAAVLILILGILAVSLLNPGGSEEPVANSETPALETPKPELPAVESTEAEIAESQEAEADADRVSAPETDLPVQKASRPAPARRPDRPAMAPGRRSPVPPSQLAENSEPPRLSEAADEELEDDSLRLTDLFTDVSED